MDACTPTELRDRVSVYFSRGERGDCLYVSFYLFFVMIITYLCPLSRLACFPARLVGRPARSLARETNERAFADARMRGCEDAGMPQSRAGPTGRGVRGYEEMDRAGSAGSAVDVSSRCTRRIRQAGRQAGKEGLVRRWEDRQQASRQARQADWQGRDIIVYYIQYKDEISSYI
jgi:hypothetical protein